MRIETIKRMVTYFCYATEELQGGHLSRHINCENGYLINRILSEEKNLATTFDCDGEQAMELVKKACLDEEWAIPECIKEWLDDESDWDNMIFDVDMGQVIGHGFFKAGWHDWNTGAVNCSVITVVLKKVQLGNGDVMFRLVTAYPYVSEADIEAVKNAK